MSFFCLFLFFYWRMFNYACSVLEPYSCFISILYSVSASYVAFFRVEMVVVSYSETSVRFYQSTQRYCRPNVHVCRVITSDLMICVKILRWKPIARHYRQAATPFQCWMQFCVGPCVFKRCTFTYCEMSLLYASGYLWLLPQETFNAVHKLGL
jgi:hypothetical protein